ncbi:transcription activator protein acu-15 [Colletotrichum asianum]
MQPEHQIELRRQDVERLEQKIRDLQTENDELSGKLAEAQQQQPQDRASSEDRLVTPATSSSSLGLQTEEQRAPAGGNEIASQVIHLSLSARGGRDFVGSTSGLFLANLLQPHSQPAAPSQLVAAQPPGFTSNSDGTTGSLVLNAASSLPPRAMATEIVNAHCSHDRLCYPFLSPKALDKALDAVYEARSTDSISPVDDFLVDMTLAIGTAQVYKLNWNGIWDAEVHYNRALMRLVDVLGRARTCFELGLHKSSTYTLRRGGDETKLEARHEDLEIKRRCFWSVVSMDRIASMILGRQLAIQLDDIDTELPHSESITTRVPLHGHLSTASFGTPEWHLATLIFAHIVRYRLICGKILNSLHRSTINRETNTTYESTRETLAEELQTWRAGTSSLPLIPADAPLASPAGRSSFRSAEWYELLYHNGILMLFRPSPSICDASRNSNVLQHMFDSSQEAIKLYANLHRSRKINYSWVTLHSIFIAGLSYIYALRNHIQHIQNRSQGSGNVANATLSSTPSISQVVNDTRACSKVLVALSERWAMARNCSEVFDRLSDAVVADVVEAQSGQTSTSTSMPFANQPADIGHVSQPMDMNLTDAMYGHETNQNFVNMSVDDTLRDCFGDLQNIYYDQYHSDAIAQLSQEWLFGLGETPSRYF